MLHGRNNENILHKKEQFFPWKEDLLLLPCKMAPVQNLYNIIPNGLISTNVTIIFRNTTTLFNFRNMFRCLSASKGCRDKCDIFLF